MGNSAPLKDPLSQIDQLNLASQDKHDLEIYVWRASTRKNQHLPRTSLIFESVFEAKTQLFLCGGLQNKIGPKIRFQKYVCDFRPLVGFLDHPQSLTLFQSVLKGYQSIYLKFNSTIIHEKCCFLTHDGQARIWINPNYFLNEFWTIQKNQFILPTSYAHEVNCETPRFMKKDEFEFESINLLTSQGVIIRKIIEWMPKFVKKSKQSIEFWAHLQKFIQGNVLNNCSFDRVQRFIHIWAYQKKITRNSNIQDVVIKLVKEGKILKENDKILQKSSKRSILSIYKEGGKKLYSDLNISIDQQQDGVSIFDIKNVELRQLQSENQNFRQIIGKSSKSPNHSLKKISKDNQFKVEGFPGKHKVSIKNKKSNNQQKIQKFFMHQKIQPHIQSFKKIEQSQFARTVVYQNVDFWSVKSEDHSIKQSREPRNNLDISNHNSISPFDSNINKTQQNEPWKYMKNLQASTEASQMNKIYGQDQMYGQDQIRPRNNSKTGSIFKKGRIKSFQISRLQTINGNQREMAGKKKNTVIVKNEKIDISDENSDYLNSKEPRFLTFGVQQGDEYTTEKGSIFKSIENEASQNQIKIYFKLEDTRRTADRTRQNSCYEAQRGQNLDLYPFKQITNYQLSSKSQTNSKLKNSNKSPFIDNRSTFNGQTSMMLNFKYLEDEIQEEVARSKRRISVGGNGNLQKMFQVQGNNEYGEMPIINQPAQKMPKTINGLFSSQNQLQTSFGSVSSTSNQFSSEQNIVQTYSGILSKMGRSVQVKKIPEIHLQKPSQFEIISRKNVNEKMPNLTKKKTICEHGTNRSMKF